MGYREKALYDWDGLCNRCKEPIEREDAEVHHVDRNGTGGGFENNNLDNLEVLCRDHHLQEHHGSEPMWGLFVDLPRDTIAALDAITEDRGYNSRAETVARLVAQAYGGPEAEFKGPTAAADSWFATDEHEVEVHDEAVFEPPCFPDPDPPPLGTGGLTDRGPP